MGYSSWSTDAWTSYTCSTAKRSTNEIFSKKSLSDDLNPLGVLIRESRDSDANPNSTAIIVACDVTGSMGMIADELVRRGIGTFFEAILTRKPISDPHMMIMGIGDVYCDTAPLQVSQFESDLTIAKWLEQIYIEHGGGGNNFESYDLPYYFAYNHTSIDCWEKRQKKGYIFTIGDEEAPQKTSAQGVKDFIGDEMAEDVLFQSVIDKASQMYNCYHIMIAQGDYARRHPDKVKSSWVNVLGQNAIWLEDYKKLSETIVSIIQVNEGENKESVVKSWSGDTSMVVNAALSGVLSQSANSSNLKGIHRF